MCLGADAPRLHGSHCSQDAASGRPTSGYINFCPGSFTFAREFSTEFDQQVRLGLVAKAGITPKAFPSSKEGFISLGQNTGTCLEPSADSRRQELAEMTVQAIDPLLFFLSCCVWQLAWVLHELFHALAFDSSLFPRFVGAGVWQLTLAEARAQVL